MSPQARRKTATKPASKPTPHAKAQAVAQENKEQLDTTLTPDDGRDVEALREERGEILKEIREHEEKKDERLREEADEAGMHVHKEDDAGAAEQQKAARDSGAKLYDRLGILTGPPVVAPIVEEGGAKIKVVSRRDGDEFDKGHDYAVVTKARFVGYNLHILGEDFPSPGEVIIDIRQKSGANHQRFSTWTEDGYIDVVLPGITGVGDYLVHAESLVTQVGEGRDDHLPLIKESNEIALELY